MDLDLTEYDQVDEIKFMENHGQVYYDGSSSKFLVTLSSCSDQASVDDTNCENDFVFLPAPPHQNQASTQTASKFCQNNAQSKTDLKIPIRTPETSTAHGLNQQVQPPRPLISMSNNINPFKGLQSYRPEELNDTADILKQLGVNSGKPLGLIDSSSAIANSNPEKLAELMQQIVTRSDSIYIAVPCAYCYEYVTCPPSDISSWLNHMNWQHNCKICPVCNKLVGLGSNRDIEIMKNHVIEHFNEEWLEKRSMRVTFSYGLQQHWFSGTSCGIRDPPAKPTFRC